MALFLCCYNGGGVCRGTEQNDLVGGESSHEAGADGRVCLRRLEPGGKLEKGQGKGGRHMGVLAGNHMSGGFRTVAAAWTKVVIPFFPLEHHVSNSRVATDKLGDP